MYAVPGVNKPQKIQTAQVRRDLNYFCITVTLLLYSRHRRSSFYLIKITVIVSSYRFLIVVLYLQTDCSMQWNTELKLLNMCQINYL